MIRFKFSPAKARAALLWMLEQKPGIDLHAVLKACYFADKDHLNSYGRPVFGAAYRAMKFGPVPIEIYEMAKGEPYWLAELGAESYPWALEGFRLKKAGSNEVPDLEEFSPSDLRTLEAGFQRSCGLDFNERTAATHGPDWQAARLGWIRYEDMLDEASDKAERVAILEQMAPHIKI